MSAFRKSYVAGKPKRGRPPLLNHQTKAERAAEILARCGVALEQARRAAYEPMPASQKDGAARGDNGR